MDAADPSATKQCRVCGETKPTTEFRKGHRRCKACTAKERRRYRLANLEKERASDRRWYVENRERKLNYRRRYYAVNQDEINERKRQWYEANPEVAREYRRRSYWANPEVRREAARRWHWENLALSRERMLQRYYENREERNAATRRWYAENRERAAEYDRRYRQENPEVGRRAAQRRRHREVGIEISQDELAYVEVLRRDPCTYCGDIAGTIDHIEPLYRGPDGRWENLTAACRECNSAKHTTSLLAFLTRRATA